MYKSKIGQLELKIIGYDEPNNGRELHIAQLLINRKDYTEKFFKDKWNRLNFNLTEFQFESENFEYVFIPAEGNSFLINTSTLDIKYLPFKGISTVCFKGNKFIKDKLIVYYNDETVEVALN